jgi:uncharacterized Zn finger protein (UPF0148 family)
VFCQTRSHSQLSISYSCTTCIGTMFSKNNRVSCPDCNNPLYRNSFVTPDAEIEALEREQRIRKEVMDDYNLTRENFNSDREYNDYLEQIEDISASRPFPPSPSPPTLSCFL